MKRIKKTDLNGALWLPAAGGAFFLLARYAPQVKEGFAAALSVCAGVIVPSLFPMLVLSSFTAALPCPTFLRKLCARPLRGLFGLSPGCATPLLLGLAGGYPLAAKTAAEAWREGLIDREDARRLTLYFTCPGVPFSVIAAGGGFFGSRPVGLTLYAACLTGNLLTATVCRLLRRRDDYPACAPKTVQKTPLPARLTAAVERASAAMISVCAWIAAFSCLTAALNTAAGGKANGFLTVFGEATQAARYAAETRNAPLAAFCLAFGGMCVACQVLPEVSRCGAGAGRYFAARLSAAGIAYLTESLLLKTLRITMPVQAQTGGFPLAADSIAGSAALLLLCAVLMAETAGPRARPAGYG